MDDWWDMTVTPPLPAGQNAGDGLLDTGLFTPGEIPVPTSNAVEEVIVMGDAPGDSGDGGGWGYWGSGGGGTGDPLTGDGGGGGSSSSSNGDGNQQHDCQAEERVDTFAKAIARNIMNQPDWTEREYGAVIYRNNDGDITFTPLARGQTVAEARANGQQNPTLTLNLPTSAALAGGEILGIVHNHPDDGYNGDADRRNRNPSAGDWAAFNSLISDGKADRDHLAHYIVDYRGTIREFHASDARTHNADLDWPSSPNSANDVSNNSNCQP